MEVVVQLFSEPWYLFSIKQLCLNMSAYCYLTKMYRREPVWSTDIDAYAIHRTGEGHQGKVYQRIGF